MTAVHQFVPMLHVRDAVGQHTVAIRDLLLGRGVDSRIFVERDDPDTSEITCSALDYPSVARPDDLLVYQFATASDLAPWLCARSERLVVNYHNITPAELFAPWDNALARHQLRAQHELTRLASRSAVGVAVSEVNRRDLEALGFAVTAVSPPIAALLQTTNGRVPGAVGPRQSGARWLAVGRLAPNKALEDVIAGLMLYRRRHDPEATLQLVGKVGLGVYADALHSYAAELGVLDAVRFVGRISDEALAAAYDDADVLVVASEHEGFCVPVVEAMARDLPVVAFAQGALPEVMGDAGILLKEKDPLAIAEAVHRVQVGDKWRAELVAGGRERIRQLHLEDAGPRMADLLLAVAAGKPLPEESAPRTAR